MGQEIEGEDLPLMDMPGELQVEKAHAFPINGGSVLEKQSEPFPGKPLREDFFRCQRLMIDPGDHRVIDTGDIDHTSGNDALPAQDPETGLSGKGEGLPETGVDLMISGNGELAVPGFDFVKEFGQSGHAVYLAVHQVAGGDQDIGR